ncbi:MAG: protein phosphatase 2C domain-containing protein [Lachnospiraceae bacterium]|nr:protein phosphatase 2C domain-containing protein [Lachnospiraceae bacterium]
MLGFYKMSLIGSAHKIIGGGVCQDASDCRTLDNGIVIAAIADGLGSSRYSDVASKIAVGTVLSYLADNLPAAWYEATIISVLRDAFGKALESIRTVAQENCRDESDYDTTLTAAVYNSRNIIFGHVGDGGIIALSSSGDYSILTTAQKGEEFNVTTPLRAGSDKWTFGRSETDVCAFVMMTDGLFDVACPWILSKTEQPVYINFVRSFIDNNVINARTSEDFNALQKEIEDYLSGEDLKNVSDDITVVGVINTGLPPAVKQEEYYSEPDFDKLMHENREKLYKQDRSGSETEMITESEEIPETDPSGFIEWISGLLKNIYR